MPSAAMVAKTALDIVKLCENQLGWIPPSGMPIWRARALHAGILTKAMTKHGASIEDLELTIELCQRERWPITTPAALVHKVEKARELSNAPSTTTVPKASGGYKRVVHEVTDLAAAVDTAVAWEQMNEDHFSLGWITRLVRAVGDYRGEVLDEWKEAGRG